MPGRNFRNIETVRQKKLAQLLISNAQSLKPKTLSEIVKEAGYRRSTSGNPSDVINAYGVQKNLKPFIEKMEAERNRLLDAMTIKNLDKLSYDRSARSLDILAKNVELLSGRETSRIGGLVDEVYANL